MAPSSLPDRVFLAAVGPVSGQINLDLKLDRSLYLAHEPITGELIIVNMAGRDLIFGESGGSVGSISLSPTGPGTSSPRCRAKPTSVPSSSGPASLTYKHKVTINRRYPMANIGTYRVKASIHFPQINRVFETKSITVQVTDGQPMWSQIVGVPQGHRRPAPTGNTLS